MLRDVPMSKHTSWHAGGPADLFFMPRDVMDLAAFIRQLPLGSAAAVDRPRQQSAGARRRRARRRDLDARRARPRSSAVSATRIHAGAGVPCARIARQCVKWGLGPAEFFAGIPGTLGGALAMNAGRLGRRDLAPRDRGGGARIAAVCAARARPADYEIGVPPRAGARR